MTGTMNPSREPRVGSTARRAALARLYFLAQALAVAAWWLAIALRPAWRNTFAMRGAPDAARFEERDLEARFGAEYRAYRQAVACWVPRRRPYVAPPRDER